MTHSCSPIISNVMVEKKEDPSAFTIPFTIETHKFKKALCDLSSSINLMPYFMYRRLGLVSPTPTTIRLLMVDFLIKETMGVLFDVLVKVEQFILSANFVVLYCDIDHHIQFIQGKPFLETGRGLVDMKVGEIKF